MLHGVGFSSNVQNAWVDRVEAFDHSREATSSGLPAERNVVTRTAGEEDRIPERARLCEYMNTVQFMPKSPCTGANDGLLNSYL